MHEEVRNNSKSLVKKILWRFRPQLRRRCCFLPSDIDVKETNLSLRHLPVHMLGVREDGSSASSGSRDNTGVASNGSTRGSPNEASDSDVQKAALSLSALLARSFGKVWSWSTT